MIKRLLIVGPKPPPIGGSPLTVQAILEELSSYSSIRVKLINTSPTIDVRKEMTGFRMEKVRRSVAIFPKYIHEIRCSDTVLVFANNLFTMTLVPIFLLLARLSHKSFYVKPVGAGLDLFIAARHRLLRAYILATLRAADGIFAQTSVLRDALDKMGCSNARYLPGCRPGPCTKKIIKAHAEEFRLIFLAHITRAKGPLILLEALHILAGTCGRRVTCDFYGPIHNETRKEFLNGLAAIPNAHYCGVAQAGSGPELIAKYDALVLPTFFDEEGHPGVLIEAMQAGVPVIVTQIRSISDLVVHGENGLLVPMRDSPALARAIQQLALDPDLQEKMGETNYHKGREFRADVVVEQMLQILFPDFLVEQ